MTDIIGGRRSGKTAAMERARDEYLRKNPRATIVTYRNGEAIVEKPVEELGPARLPAPVSATVDA